MRLTGSGAALLGVEAEKAGASVEAISESLVPDIVFVAKLGLLADPALAPPRPLYLKAADVKPQNSNALSPDSGPPSDQMRPRTMFSLFAKAPPPAYRPIGLERSAECALVHAASFAYPWDETDFEQLLVRPEVVAEGAIETSDCQFVGVYSVARRLGRG